MPSSRRILLIEPPFYRLFKNTYSLDRLPLGLAYLAGVAVRDAGWHVRVWNADFQSSSEPWRLSYLAGDGFRRYRERLDNPEDSIWRQARVVLESYGPGVVGISAKSQTFASAARLAEVAKRVLPRATVLVGGPHPSMVREKVLQCPHIDAACFGEGEGTLRDVLAALDAGRPLAGIAGLIWRDDAGQAVVGPDRPLIEDLDALPYPHDHAADVLQDHREYPPSAFGYVFSARGCPYDCLFCGSRNVWSRRVRFRSPDDVVEEVRSLAAQGLLLVHFDDDTFGVRRERVLELARALHEGCPQVRWSCEMHVNLVDADLMAAMRECGCHSIQLGIESGSDEILASVRKSFTLDKALAACRSVRKAGIDLVTFFMVGFPQETEATLAETARAIHACKCDTAVLSIFTPYPGTEAFEQCRQAGLVDEDFDVALYNHHSPVNCFTPYIEPKRFGQLAGKLQRMVDRKNARTRLRKLLSPQTLRRARELGLRGTLAKARRTFLPG